MKDYQIDRIKEYQSPEYGIEFLRYKEIQTEKPLNKIWQLLHFFHDKEGTAQQIANINKINIEDQLKNCHKQAQQISYCIRQAEEYFLAASAVSLATKPTLLYYGAVSLSQFLILLRGDGRSSFDFRRKQKGKQHNHHGLNMKTNLDELKKESDPEKFFKHLHAEINLNTKKEALGNFVLFYSALSPSITKGPEINIKLTERTGMFFNAGIYSLGKKDIGSFTPPYKISIWNIIKNLPDIYYLLKELGIIPLLCRIDNTGHMGEDIKLEYKNDNLDNYIPSKMKYKVTCFNEESNQFKAMDDYFRNPLGRLADTKDSIQYNRRSCPPGIIDEISITVTPIKGNCELCFPNVVESIEGGRFCILNPGEHITEPASMLILLFTFSYLSRYCPDIWMRVISENVKIAEIIDSILNTAIRKFPLFILDQATRTKHFIHL